jgi:hypothetical protein
MKVLYAVLQINVFKELVVRILEAKHIIVGTEKFV